MGKYRDELVSVLIPSYNRVFYIMQCINSIKCQRYKKIKIIVYDDGSTDETKELMRNEPEIQYIRSEENRGVGFARNVLLEKCKSRYAAWQDSDDLSHFDRITEQIKLISSSKSPFVYTNWRYFKTEDSLDLAGKSIATKGDLSSCLGGLLFDMQCAGHYNFDQDITMGGEDLIWRNEIENDYGRGEIINRILYFIRLHPNRISREKLLRKNREERIKSDDAYHKRIAIMENK